MTEQEKREKVIKPILGYEGLYSVDNLANIYSVRRNMKLLTKRINPNGCEVVSLCRDGKCETKKVHRIVAEAFIPNPDNLPYINHKDEDRTNNIPDNLEWCTPRYNIMYNGANRRAAETKRGRKHTQAHKDSIAAGIKAYYSTHESKLKGRPVKHRKPVTLKSIQTGEEIQFPSVMHAGAFVGNNSG